MPINDNTSRLGTGFRARVTGRQFSDPNAAAISGQIARENYRATFKSDYKLGRIRKYVKKLVSTFSKGDKLAILSEYGDPRRGQSDEAVVEALITNLRESDLELLVKDVEIDEGKLNSKVRQIKDNKRRQGSKFSTRTFEDVYSKIGATGSVRNVRKAIQAYDNSFKIPREVLSQFGSLKREVEKVLNDVYNPVELTGMALKMEIDFGDGASKRQLVNMITNKVLLFVSLITGKTKAGYAASIVNDAPYKEILQYTSYSWTVGVSGMSKEGLTTLKKQALEARAKGREAFIQKRKTTGIMGMDKNNFERVMEVVNPLNLPKNLLKLLGQGAGGLVDLAGMAQNIPGIGGILRGTTRGITGGIGGLLGGIGGGFKYLTSLGREGGMISGAREGAAAGVGALNNASAFLRNPLQFGEMRLENEARGRVTSRAAGTEDYLDNMRDQELFEEAAKYGLKPRRDQKSLKRDIRIQIEKKRIRLERLRRQEREASERGRAFDPKKSAEMSNLASELKTIDKAADGKGELEDFQSSSKIPYLRFSFSTLGIDVSKLKAVVPVFVTNGLSTKEGNDDTGTSFKELLEQNEEAIEEAKKKLKDEKDPAKIDELEKLIALKETTRARYFDTSSAIKTTGGGGISLSSSLEDIRSKIFDEKTGIKGFQNKGPGSIGDEGRINAESVTFDTTPGMMSDDRDYIDLSKPSEAFVSNGTRALRVFDVSSVIGKSGGDDSKSRAFFSEQAVNLGIKKIMPQPASPVYVVNKSVPTDTGKLLLGVAKMLLNLIPGGGLISGQLDSLATGDGDIASMIGLATGGTGRAAGLGRKTTHFISGDSLGKRPNPEQVSINWSDKSYSVKPIPQFAEGGSQSASGQIRRMTPSERQEPMKVFSVNPGITDMVDMNGSNVSLIGLVAEMNGRLGTIEGLLAIANNNTASIATTSAATATGVRKIGSSSGGTGQNPFAGGGFPSELNPILSGA